MFARVSCLLMTTALVAAVGCGTEPVDSTPPTFAAEPDQMIASDSGARMIAVRFSPRPPAVGTDAAQLQILDALGLPASGLGLEVVPWMPAHGHGTSVNPTVT